MKRIETPSIIILIILIVIAGCTSQKVPESKSEIDIYAGLEFPMPEIEEPVIPDYSVNLKDFGAVSGGQILNSKAFADAIEAVTQRGGGRVIIPSGIWLTGPIILKSNLELYTEPGALVIFSDNKD